MYKLRYLSYGYGKFDHLTTWVEKKTFVGRERGCKEALKYKKTWTLYDEMMPNNWCFKERKAGDFPGGPVVKTVLPMQEVQVWSLVKELRSMWYSQRHKGIKAKIWTQKVYNVSSKTFWGGAVMEIQILWAIHINMKYKTFCHACSLCLTACQAVRGYLSIPPCRLSTVLWAMQGGRTLNCCLCLQGVSNSR